MPLMPNAEITAITLVMKTILLISITHIIKTKEIFKVGVLQKHSNSIQQ